MAAAFVVISTRLDLIGSGKYINPEEAKAPLIAKMGPRGTVAAGPFRCRDKVDGQEVESKPQIPTLFGR